MEVGKRIKELRISSNLTQKEVAQHLNIDRSTLATYESGTREMSYAMILRIAEFFDVSIDYLFDRKEL